ncbi:MAG: hypothetical protein EBT26_10885, partial [Microbacteriaceae bacterium]|nr:hypothetical protein [Microbacteriaceae bacterium]
GNDVTLATFQVNGEDVEDGGSLDLPPLTTSVEVTVETTDPDATFVVTGDTGLEVGQNVLTVSVTAADGETTADYTVTLNVPLNNDATLSTFQVNGVDVEDGATVEVEYGTTEVDVVATPTDANATVVVVGGTDLQPGENTIVVTVTAEDGETVAEYTVTVVVKPSSDTTLSEFTVNGNPVDSGDYVELELGTTSVEVVVVTTDEGATYEIEGGADLQPGENTLTVTVTAADGETTQEYVVTLFVLLSDDTSLSTFKINGVDVEDGSDLELPAYTSEVEVEAVATNADAQVEVSGADSLQPGENRVEVTVTAADGETVQVYTVFVTVLISTDTRVSEILVNGVSALDGDVVLSTDLELTEVEVEVTTVDENSTVEIVGNTELVKGDNLITITVTAPSGDVRDYTVTFRLGGLPGNAKLKSLIVAGTAI